MIPDTTLTEEHIFCARAAYFIWLALQGSSAFVLPVYSEGSQVCLASATGPYCAWYSGCFCLGKVADATRQALVVTNSVPRFHER
jgi:hypothetical protein